MDFVLTLSCPDRVGVVHAVTGLLAQHEANIVDSQEYGDPGTGRFFMRVHAQGGAGVAEGLPALAEQFAMEWQLSDLAERERVLVLVSKQGHCLQDCSTGALPADIAGVVSNINIHHSFLPSFKGARPYHQAHDWGVKLIGATAHFVTADLDEGPIIEQEVARVTHAHTPEQLGAVDAHLETVCLARAVRWHLEHRVLRNGHRTVVFA